MFFIFFVLINQNIFLNINYYNLPKKDDILKGC